MMMNNNFMHAPQQHHASLNNPGGGAFNGAFDQFQHQQLPPHYNNSNPALYLQAAYSSHLTSPYGGLNAGQQNADLADIPSP